MSLSKGRRHRVVAVVSLLIAIEIFSTSHLTLAQSHTDNAVINSFLAKHARRESASEYKEARSVVRGDLNGDREKDAVVLYTLEGAGGTNQYTQYQAVFVRRAGKLQYVTNEPVGGKNVRTIDSVSIKDGKIYLQTLEYLPTDPSCCPSKKGRARFVLRRGKLKEV